MCFPTELPSFSTIATRSRVRLARITGEGRSIRHGDLISPTRKGAGGGARTTSTQALGVAGATPTTRVTMVAPEGPTSPALATVPFAKPTTPVAREVTPATNVALPPLRDAPKGRVGLTGQVPPASARRVATGRVAPAGVGPRRPDQVLPAAPAFDLASTTARVRRRH